MLRWARRVMPVQSHNTNIKVTTQIQKYSNTKVATQHKNKSHNTNAKATTRMLKSQHNGSERQQKRAIDTKSD